MSKKKIQPHKTPPQQITAENYRQDEEIKKWLIQQGYELQVPRPEENNGKKV